MEIEFEDTFFDSLKRMSNSHKIHHWRFYVSKYYDLRSFLKSFFTYSYKSTMIKDWQFSTIFPLMKKHLEKLCYLLEHYGIEVDESRLPKIVLIKRTIELLNHYIESDYQFQAEQLLNRKISNWSIFDDTRTNEQKKLDSEIYDMANKIEQDQWDELWETIRSNGKGWWD